MKTNVSGELISSKKFLKDFNTLFYYEILKSQRASSIGICFIGLFVSTIWTIIWLFLQEKVNASMGFPFPAREVAFAFYGITIYELLYTLLINYSIKRRKRLPVLAKYFNAFLEASFATIIMIVLAEKFPSKMTVFYSPALTAYFVFISLAVMKLDFFIGVFTGVVAAVGYILTFIFYVNTETHDIAATYFTSDFGAVIRGVTMVVSGVAIGFAAHQLRKRVYISLQSLSDKNAIISMFGQYISPVVVERLINQKSEFPPELRHVCILFIDIRNFTGFAESRSPKEVIDFLNRFFLPLIDVINKHNGFINKFLGDGFMAIFGAPIFDGQDVQHGIQAAFAMLKKIEEMNQSGEIPPTRCGIGLNAGLAMTGNVGSEERKEYTVIGDTVNLASRLEQLNKEFQSQIIVSESVYQFIQEEHPALKKVSVSIRGKAEKVDAFILA